MCASGWGPSFLSGNEEMHYFAMFWQRFFSIIIFVNFLAAPVVMCRLGVMKAYGWLVDTVLRGVLIGLRGVGSGRFGCRAERASRSLSSFDVGQMRFLACHNSRTSILGWLVKS